MEIPEVKQTEQAQHIKHVQLGSGIYAVDDILRVCLYKQQNPTAYKGTLHLRSMERSSAPYEIVTATVAQYKIMQEVLCGGVT